MLRVFRQFLWGMLLLPLISCSQTKPQVIVDQNSPSTGTEGDGEEGESPDRNSSNAQGEGCEDIDDCPKVKFTYNLKSTIPEFSNPLIETETGLKKPLICIEDRQCIYAIEVVPRDTYQDNMGVREMDDFKFALAEGRAQGMDARLFEEEVNITWKCKSADETGTLRLLARDVEYCEREPELEEGEEESEDDQRRDQDCDDLTEKIDRDHEIQIQYMCIPDTNVEEKSSSRVNCAVSTAVGQQNGNLGEIAKELLCPED